MICLVGCEESQAVTIELRKLGHEAYSCDLQMCSGNHPEWHLNMDVFEAIKGGELKTQSGETVSKILGKKVTAKHAQLYANESWGELRAYIKAEVVADILESRKKNKETNYRKLLTIKYESTKNRGKKS